MYSQYGAAPSKRLSCAILARPLWYHRMKAQRAKSNYPNYYSGMSIDQFSRGPKLFLFTMSTWIFLWDTTATTTNNSSSSSSNITSLSCETQSRQTARPFVCDDVSDKRWKSAGQAFIVWWPLRGREKRERKKDAESWRLRAYGDSHCSSCSSWTIHVIINDRAVSTSLSLSLSLFPVDQRARRCSASTIMLIFERKEERKKEKKS